MRHFQLSTFVFAVVALACAASPALAQVTVTGGNFSADPTEIAVPYATGSIKYQVSDRIIFDPSAGPLLKHFESPRTVTGALLVLGGSQPFPQVIEEDFTLLSEGNPAPRAVSDWHEIIITPGWVWYLPGDPGSAEWFPEGTTLITRDGQSWDSTLFPTNTPTALGSFFAPIEPSHIIDIHKALLFVGTETNAFWGDDTSETVIDVWEYPTPEPSSIVLAAAGLIGLVAFRRRRRL